METTRWNRLRGMFETVCDFPPAQWEQALRAISDDTELVAEALSLLAAQTASFNRALQPLGELMASLASGELQPGDRLGVWQLAGQLGSGGMGSVFVAERADRLFRQRVAIKLLRDSVAGPAVAERLAAERQILAQLHHPNIARLYDGGTTPGGQPYLVMEYVEGLPLDDYCARHALPLTERLRLFLRVCAAVQAAHQQLVVHCDLKPSNVLVRSDGQPMLLDFGIARSMGEGGATSHGFCTPAYASPELLAGEHVGVAADVFSLGVLLTELLAGRPAGRGPADRGRSVPSPSALAGRASRGAWRDLDAIAARACALDPALRYPSVEALALDIGRHLDRRPVTARGNAIAYRAGRFVRRHWRESALAAALLVSTVAFVLRLDAARTRAEHEARVAREVSDFLADAFSADAAPAADSAGEVTARQILDRARVRIAGSGYDPALRARLWLVLGRAYRGLGATAAAERMLREAAAGYLSPGVAQPLQAAEALSELSVLMSNQMRSADAVAAARRVVELRDAGGADRESLADSYNVLGLALLRNAQLRQARGALEKSLALRRQLFGAESMQASAALHNLGLLEREAGDNLQAERRFRDALAIRRAADPQSDATQSSLQGLAVTLGVQGRHAEAISLLRENLALAQRLYGADSGKIAHARVRLAIALQDTGAYALASRELQQAAFVTEHAGADSLEHASVLDAMASLTALRGNDAAAARLYRRVLAIREARLDSGDPLLLRTRERLGGVLARGPQAQAGDGLFAATWPAWQRRYREEERAALALIEARSRRAEWLLWRGRIAEAEALLGAIPDDQPPLALRARVLRAEAMQQRRNWPAAVASWRAAIALADEQVPAASAAMARLRVPYAEALAAVGDRDGALAQLQLAAAPLQRELLPGAALIQRLHALQARLASPAPT